MKDTTYYCNCDSPCVNKGNLRKVKTLENGKWRKEKCQLCLNDKNDCTCRYRTANLCNVFKY